MIEPTNGRVVWYHPSADDGLSHRGQPLAATVAHVWNDRQVNLTVSDSNGNVFARQRVTLLQDNDVPGDGAYAEWMPYQKGQAAKTEALEQAALVSPPDESDAAAEAEHAGATPASDDKPGERDKARAKKGSKA